MEVFGNQRLPEAAEVVRARLAALFQPAAQAGGTSAGPPGEPTGPQKAAAAEHLRPDDAGRDRRRLTSRHLAVMAALTLVGVVVSLGWLLRAKAVPMAVAVSPETSPVASRSSSGLPSSAAPSPADRSAVPTILVHVIGSVASPGLVRVAMGARVADVLAAAGGLSAEADPAELNLAAVVADGSQIVIGTRASPRGEVREGAASGTAAAGPTGAGVLIDLNTATPAQLDTLPGVGPVTSQAILDYRTKHGRFTKIEELQEVDGIGAKTYAQIAPHVRV